MGWLLLLFEFLDWMGLDVVGAVEGGGGKERYIGGLGVGEGWRMDEVDGLVS